MATPGQQQFDVDQSEDLLRVSAYDKASSMLISLLVIVGTAVTFLFILWLTSRVFWVPTQSKLVLLEEEDNQEPPGSERDISEPGMEELDDLVEPDVEDQLAAVTDAVSAVAASLDAVDNVVSRRGNSMDNRKPGSDSGVIPRYLRWEIRFQDTTLKDYAKQLGFFEIELGALGGGIPGIDYLSFGKNGVSKKRTAKDPSKDDRIYFIWQGGKFKEQDRALLNQGGVATSGRILCQFYSKDLENKLAHFEKDKLGNRELKAVQKTIFGIQGSAGNYEFYVMDIRFR